MNEKIYLSLIVPCFNEQDNVKLFFDEVNRVFDGKVQDYEFVFVNDGSRDKTYERLNELYNDNPSSKIQVLHFSRNFGKEAAIYAGLSNAKGDYVCLIDADLQQRPEVVLRMLDEIQADSSIDCVTAYQEDRSEGKLMIKAKESFYKVISKMSEIEFKNGASDFRLLNRNMVNAILQMTEYHRFSKGLFAWVGFNTKFIPYVAQERETGTSKWNTGKLIKYALEGIISFSTVPLRLSTLVGFISAIASIIYLIIVVIQKLAFGINVPGYATIVVLLLLIGGIQLFCLGILGEYLAKVYLQVKNRPVYILKEHLK